MALIHLLENEVPPDPDVGFVIQFHATLAEQVVEFFMGPDHVTFQGAGAALASPLTKIEAELHLGADRDDIAGLDGESAGGGETDCGILFGMGAEASAKTDVAFQLQGKPAGGAFFVDRYFS